MTDYGTFTIQPKTSGPTEHAPAAARRSWIAEAWAWLVTTISNLFQARVVEARGPESAPRGLEGRASILSSSAESTDTHSDGVSIDSEEGSTSAQAGATRLNRSPSLEVILPKKTSRGEKIREEYLSVVRDFL